MRTDEDRGRSHGGVRAHGKAASPLLLVAGALLACASAPRTAAVRGDPAPVVARDAGEVAGIHVEALRLSAAGYIVDFRYRVVDAERAAPLLDGKQRPYLVDARGAKLGVPNTPILGSLRQTSRNGKVSTSHSYFILFANPGKYLRSGDRVTLVVGDATLPDLAVE